MSRDLRSMRTGAAALPARLLVPTGVALVTWWAAGIGYLFAHTLAELFSIVIAITAMVVASTSRQFTRNHFAVLASVAIGWAAGIDLLHTLVFKGMQLLPGNDANPSVQLWVAARFLQTVGMLMAPLALQRELRVGWLHLGFGGASVLTVGLIFGGHFPVGYVEGQGLTPFKIYTEYVIMALLGVSALWLRHRRHLTTPDLYWGMTTATLLMIATEFAFTRYVSVYAPANLIGHVLKIYAYWFVYLALVRTTLQEPFSMLSRIVSSYDAVPDPTLIIDVDGRIRQANQAAARLSGQPMERLVGQSSHDCFHDPSLSPSDCPVCARVGQVRQAFTQLLELPGPRYVECTVTPCQQVDEGNLRVQVLHDVSHQKQVELELAEHRRMLEQRVAERTAELQATTQTLNQANERFEAILNGASAGIMLVRDRRIQQCNQRLAELTGYRMDELVGQPTQLLYADPQVWLQAGQELYGELAAGRQYAQIQLARRKDGSTFWVRLSASALEARDLSKGIVGMIEDISAERQAAEALRLANEQQQAVFDAAPVGVVLTRDRVILRCNRTMERLFGYGPDELIGQTTRVFHPDDETYEALTRRLLDSLATQGFFREEMRVVRKDGSRFWCRNMVQVIDRSDPGKGFAGTFEDIGKERVAIEEMARARALAEDAARTKAAFLANMSHEIRTPMNSVIGMALLALNADPSPRVRNYLQKIQSSSQHLLGLINDILDFSKLEADKMTLECRDFELPRLFEHIESVFADEAADKGIGLGLHIGPEVPHHLVGDPLRLEQVLINLVNNAVKFTDRGEVDVGVRLEERVGDEVVLRFSVRDTGIGIPPEARQRLFQSFQQADSSTTRKFGGTGLGLAISKRLAELMGGHIGVDSTGGEGSTFWFTARLQCTGGPAGLEPSDRVLEDPGLLAADALSTRAQFVGARALLVEDNELNQEVATEFLQSLGLTVDLAPDGRVAVDRVQQTTYDVVLMDMQMPVMDGLTATIEIRKLPQFRDLPILAMTANAMAGDRDRCLAAGMNDHIAKPIDPQDLVAKLHRWVKAMPERLPVQTSSSRPGPMSSGDSADGATLEALRRVPGLDADLGLKRSMGRASLYLGLLGKFVQGQRDAPERIQAALDGGRWEEAERAAHTLKGVSAQIGADAIRAQAERLEHALHARAAADVFAPWLDGLTRDLPPLLDAIAAHLPLSTEPLHVAAADPAAWQALRSRLEALLADDDAACEQLFSDNEGLVRAGMGPDYERFAKAIRHFDFPEALLLLQQAVGPRR
jgi:PAS domain S-box-containing protein